MGEVNESAPAYRGFSLLGKTALVTGASGGLGLEMARGLAGAGARVFVNGRNPARLEGVRAQLAAENLTVEPLVFDVEDDATVLATMANLRDRDVCIDILVNNVGIRDRRPLRELDPAAFRRLLDNHVVAGFSVAKAVMPMMIRRGGGRIINMVSVSAFLASTGDAAYTAAKGAVVSLTRALAAELGEHSITVNAIAPGPFATKSNQAQAESPQAQAWLARRSALGRWGRPEEIAGAAVFLASEAASFVSGHVLVVDGGMVGHY